MAGHLTGLQRGRPRVGVLPALPSRSEPILRGQVKDITPILASLNEKSGNKQLVPICCSNLSNMNAKSWTVLKSRDSDESVGNPFLKVTSRVTTLEEANKAILEEVYRLQSTVRASDFAKKEMLKEERRVQRELVETIRSSNTEISQLMSRLRNAEENLHQERENVKSLSVHSQKLEQILFSAQKEADTQRDEQNIQAGDMKQRMEDLFRRWEKNERISESIIDEFRQLQSKVEHQAMEFVHMLNELRQRSDRMENELKQALQHAQVQQDNNNMVEQNNAQISQLLEAGMSQVRDAIDELRTRVTQTDNNARAQVQQLSVKISELQPNSGEICHLRPENMPVRDVPHLNQTRYLRRRCPRPPYAPNSGGYYWPPDLKKQHECVCSLVSPKIE